MLPRLLILLVSCTLASACHSPGCHGTGALAGNVADHASGAGIYQALVAVELGGLDVPITNPNLGSSAYSIGMVTDHSGNFGINVVCGNYGVHAFAPGYETMGVQVLNGTHQNLDLIPQNGNGPTIGALTIAPTSVNTTTKVTASVTVAAASSADPLSQHILLIGEDSHFAAALNPPSAGSTSSGYPDGVYTLEFQPDPIVGIHSYTVVAASLAGLTGTPQTANVTVHD